MSDYNEFFYDTEFLERGAGYPLDLISIAMVHPASGKKYYAVNADMPEAEIKKHKWLMDNVWPYLPTTKQRYDKSTCRCLSGHLDLEDEAVKPRAQIAAELSEFVRVLGSSDRAQNRLWAYYCSYDHVVLSQLYGRMIDLPPHMPMFTWDLKVEAEAMGATELPEQKLKEHHALADAQWNVQVARYLGVI